MFQSLDILAIGNLTFDTIYEVDRLPKVDETGLVLHRKTYFGGRAGDIAVIASRLGLKAGVASVVGHDFVEKGYQKYLHRREINTDTIRIIEDQKCPEVHLFKDKDASMIYFFQPNVQKLGISLIITPDVLSKSRIVYMTAFDSENSVMQLMNAINGHGEVFFGFGEEIYRRSLKYIKTAIGISTYLQLNAQEFDIFLRRMKLKAASELFSMSEKLRFIAVTLAKRGSMIYTPEQNYSIPAVRPRRLVNSLGAGDAYSVGLIFGIIKKFHVRESAQMASVLSSFVVESDGAQTNLPRIEAIRCRYKEMFGNTFF